MTGADVVGAERRSVTVMFCDLVGSTAMSELLDPEELYDVVNSYQMACREVVERYEGHVAKYLGDGVLVFFGYPTAHDDDVPRSIRAGLAVVDAVEKLNESGRFPGAALQTRIGIHTGTVVAGMLEPGSDELSVVGSTPNIAARLQDIATPDSVVVSEESQRIAEGYFQWSELGEFTLKGIAEPVRAFRPVAANEIRTPFELAILKGLRPLVGRDAEVATLRERYRAAARDSAGQVVRLVGEGGIGKSRLLHALREDPTLGNVNWLAGRCTAESRNTAFYPLLEILRRLIGLDSHDGPVEQSSKLETAVAGIELHDASGLLASLLSIESEVESERMLWSPELQRQRTMEVIAELLIHTSRRSPLVVSIEDLHWIDPSTLDFIEMFTGMIESERVLLALTYRPTFEPGEATAPYVTEIALSTIGAIAARHLVTEVAGAHQLSDATVDLIVDRADGVPLFVEELTKMVVESAEDSEGDTASSSSAQAIPATLESSLRTRLDRLGDAKSVIQLAAVVGRDFGWETIKGVGAFDEADLARSLDTLVAAELLGRSGTGPDSHFTFRHALIQDAAYQSLLRRTRRDFHARIAEMAARDDSVIGAGQPEFLAHHYSEAGMAEPAAAQWLAAGQRAAERWANVEAIAHFESGLEQVEQLPEDRARWEIELGLLMGLGAALNASRGYGSPEAERSYTRALELCDELGDSPQLFWVLWGLGAFRQARGQHEEALEKGRQLGELAQSRRELQAEAHFGTGTSLFYLGRLEEARVELTAGSEFFLRQVDEQDVSPTGHHAGVMSLGYLAMTLQHLGEHEEARRRTDQSIGLAAQIGHPFIHFQSLHWATFASTVVGDRDAARAQAEEEVTVSTKYGFPFGQLGGGLTLAWLAATDGASEAVDQMHGMIAAYRGVGARVALTYYYGLLADACRHVGRLDEAFQAVDAGIAEAEETGEAPWLPELHRLRGVLLAPIDADRAAQSLHTAIEIARGQRARCYEVRAADSLAELADSDPHSDVPTSVADLSDIGSADEGHR